MAGTIGRPRLPTSLLFLLILAVLLQCLRLGGSMKARLYLIRHAETIANRQGILQGHCDYPLTPEGEAHSKALGELLHDRVWDKVYSSDLQRALSSAHNILSKSSTGDHVSQLIKTDLLRESNFGVREGLHRDISALQALEIKAAQLNVPVDEVIDTTETPAQIKERQRQFLLYLYDDLSGFVSANDTGDRPLNIVCITHGAFIKRFLLNYADAKIDSGIENCSVSILNVEWRSKEDFTCFAKDDEINVGCEAPSVP